MSTPLYNGIGQPADFGAGLLGRLGSFFGASTPTYAGTGQPVIASGGLLGSTTPIYAMGPPVAATAAAQAVTSQQASVPTPRGCTCGAAENEAKEQALMTCPIDPEALASGHIAIVIPRERLGPCGENT